MLLAAGCAAGKVPSGQKLVLSMDPPELQPGRVIVVTARPEPKAEMAWVSGTVKIMGAPVMPFRRDPGGEWRFKTMIPAFAVIDPGSYEARAWGDAVDGRRFEGKLTLVVKP